MAFRPADRLAAAIGAIQRCIAAPPQQSARTVGGDTTTGKGNMPGWLRRKDSIIHRYTVEFFRCNRKAKFCRKPDLERVRAAASVRRKTRRAPLSAVRHRANDTAMF